jgi:5'-nucleotidase
MIDWTSGHNERDRMTYLLTNDDGIDAPGLAALVEALAGSEVTIVAPEEHHSGCSHLATTSRPLALRQLDPRRYALDGSPVDCARIGLMHVAPQARWVLAGVNQGGNLGADVFLSGTVAAAREACLLGKPAIAISQYVRRRPIDWLQTLALTRHVLEMLLDRPPEPGSFWNVNLPQPEQAGPDVPECVFCSVDPNPLPVNFELRDGKFHYTSRYQDRLRTDGYDVEICFAGRIAISQVHLHAPAPGVG